MTPPTPLILLETVPEEHIDVQGIVDGLYYPFYMEKCRHRYVKEVLDFDIAVQAKRGVNLVLIEYAIKFKRPLSAHDTFQVSCAAKLEKVERPVLIFDQEIVKQGKVMTEATFRATCIPSSGGRPFLPDWIIARLLTGEKNQAEG